MNRFFLFAVAILVGSSIASMAAQAKVDSPSTLPPHPDTYDDLIAKQAKRHGVPESLIHRVIVRESKYRPTAMNRIYFGLMQITYATARSMGYKGSPKGLLDAETNLTYAVPYLANAYMVGGKNEDRAVALYAAGYYFEARRQHKLDLLRTALSEPLVPPPPVVAQVQEPPQNPVAMLFHALAGDPAPPPADPAAASIPANVASAATPAAEAAPVQQANAAPSQTAAADTESAAKPAPAAEPNSEAKSMPPKKKTAAKKMIAAHKTVVAKSIAASEAKPVTQTAALPTVPKPDAK